LDEVASLCDRVVVIDKGISAFADSFDAFKALSAEGDLRQSFMAVINPAGIQKEHN
jgi:sodium transport system ATP-binding protein